jgi:hypothetical protein
MTTLHPEGSLYSPPVDNTEQLCGFEPWEPWISPKKVKNGLKNN